MHIVFSIHFIDFINSRAYNAERVDNAYGSRFHACPIIIYTRGEWGDTLAPRNHTTEQ